MSRKYCLLGFGILFFMDLILGQVRMEYSKVNIDQLVAAAAKVQSLHKKLGPPRSGDWLE